MRPACFSSEKFCMLRAPNLDHVGPLGNQLEGFRLSMAFSNDAQAETRSRISAMILRASRPSP